MVVLKRKGPTRRLGLFEEFYFFLIVLYTGASTPYTQVLLYPIREHVLFIIIPVILTCVLLIRNRISFDKFFLPISIFLLWIFFQFLKYGQIYPMTVFYIYNFVLSFVIVNVYNKKLFFLFEKYVTILSLIGLIIWILNLFFSKEINGFMSSFSLIKGNGTLRSSIIIATISNSLDILGPRNSGFAQEPGMYAALVCIAIYFNLIRNKFIIKNNNPFFILLISLITTQSTTGYSVAILLFCFYLYNQKGISKYIYMILLLLLIPLTIGLPFIGEKISNNWYNVDSKSNAADMVSYNKNFNSIDVFVPQRIDAIVFDFINFIHDPILGYSIEDDNSYISRTVSKNIILSEGVVNLFARFGLIIGSCFLFYLLKSSKFLSSFYRYKGSIFLFLLWASISISYDFNRQPLLLSIWLFVLFSKQNIYIKINSNANKIWYK